LKEISGKALLLLAVVAMFGCGDDESPIAPTPTPPVTVTDTFSGSLNRNGAATHNFTASSAGVVTATLKSLSPNSEIQMGFSVGIFSAGQCSVVLTRDQAVQSSVIYANVNAPGELCVRLFDIGQVVDTTDYSVEVIHP
jgi:hypothetical protein